MIVRSLEPSESAAAVLTLADAFADDPAMCWAGGFDDGSERLRPLWRFSIGSRRRHPEPLMYTTERQEAVALWDAPGYAVISDVDGVRALPALVRAFRWGTPRFLKIASVMDRAHPTEPHFYLFAVGVRRDQQGRGLGSAVIQPMLDRCDDEGLPAYLENSKPRNEAFYARHGFEPMEPFRLPDGVPPIMPMWRSPR